MGEVSVGEVSDPTVDVAHWAVLRLRAESFRLTFDSDKLVREFRQALLNATVCVLKVGRGGVPRIVADGEERCAGTKMKFSTVIENLRPVKIFPDSSSPNTLGLFQFFREK